MKLYIVEDDLTLAGELVRLCGRWGFEAVHALRFREIQEEFQEVRPDLVLMDINLPFYDGFYWCEKIRKSPGCRYCFCPAGTRMRIRLWEWPPVETITWKNPLTRSFCW